MAKKEDLTYEQAAAELNQILQTIQSDACGIDKLIELTRRASLLLQICRDKLTTTEAELQQILEQIKN